METIRTFIAIELPDQARTALTGLQNRLKGLVPARSVRWTAVENIHLTLHFLGNIAAGDVDQAAAALQVAAAGSAPFQLELAGLGCFPHTRRPRVIWTGVAGELEPLVALHGDLGRRLQVIDFKPESRPYAPHLTLGRIKKRIPSRQVSQVGEMLEQEAPGVGRLARLPVREICLFQSDLTPTGPIYTVLARSALGKR